jgi:hypothetical protein
MGRFLDVGYPHPYVTRSVRKRLRVQGLRRFYMQRKWRVVGDEWRVFDRPSPAAFL